MRLFYSGAKTLNSENFSPEKSLGGFISSTQIPNGKVESIFSNFSNMSINSGVYETKGLFIKNTFPYTVKNLLVYCVYPDQPKVQMFLSAIAGNELELLRSSSDDPYYVTFYDVEVAYSKSTIKIVGPFLIGENVVLQDVLIPVPNGLISEFITNAVNAFSTNILYEVVKIDDLTIELKYRKIGIYGGTPTFTTVNTGALIPSNFTGGKDNSQLISAELPAGGCIGVFLKRKPNQNIQQKPLQYYKDLLQKFKDSNFNVVQNVETEEIKFCLEWDDPQPVL